MLFRTTKIINLSYLLIALSIVCATNAEKVLKKLNITATSRMVGGKIITIDKAPYTVSLRVDKYSDFTACGGALISSQHVLTAAHCFEKDESDGDDDYIDTMYVVAGASLRTDAGERRNIAKVYIHPQRVAGGDGYDVAVLKLDKPYVEGPKIKFLTEFCKTSPKKGDFMRVTGWGAKRSLEDADKIKEEDYSNELREIRVPIITNDDCTKRAEPFFKKFAGRAGFVNSLKTTNICAYKKGEDPCGTDSGGPGLYGKKMCVIVAGGFACGFGDYPGFYTDVARVLPFIEEKLKL